MTYFDCSQHNLIAFRSKIDRMEHEDVLYLHFIFNLLFFNHRATTNIPFTNQFKWRPYLSL